MTASVVTVTALLPYTAEIRGKAALRVLARAGVPRLYDHKPSSGGSGCWTFPRSRIPDLRAAAETLRGIRLVVEHQQEALL